VHLVDAGEEVGGHLNWVTRMKGLSEWHRVVDHRQVLASKLPNLGLITGRTLNAQDIRQYGADIVVLATGAHWDASGVDNISHRPLPGVEQHADRVHTPDTILRDGREPVGDHILIYDADGYFMGPSLAERFALAGKRVTLVKSEATLEGYLAPTGEGPQMIATLLDLGVEILTSTIVADFRPGAVSCESLYSQALSHVVAADDIVLVTQRLSNSSLYEELMSDPAALEAAGINRVLRIGDCLEPRVIADAIFDGHRIAREIDSGDPAHPLPMVREHRVVGANDDYYDGMLAGREPLQPDSHVRPSLVGAGDTLIKENA
jgi:dimethylamine/trimethylamine dehydrogenase